MEAAQEQPHNDPSDGKLHNEMLLSLDDTVRAKLATSMNGAKFCYDPKAGFTFTKRRETVEDPLLVTFGLVRKLPTSYLFDLTVKQMNEQKFYDLSDLTIYVAAEGSSELLEGERYSLKPHEIRFSKLQFGTTYFIRFEGDNPWVGVKLPVPPKEVEQEPEPAPQALCDVEQFTLAAVRELIT